MQIIQHTDVVNSIPFLTSSRKVDCLNKFLDSKEPKVQMTQRYLSNTQERMNRTRMSPERDLSLQKKSSLKEIPSTMRKSVNANVSKFEQISEEKDSDEKHQMTERRKHMVHYDSIPSI